MAKGGKGIPNPRKGHRVPDSHPWRSDRTFFYSKRKKKQIAAEENLMTYIDKMFG